MWQDIKNIYHFFNAVLANLWYGFPSRRFKVIGVTGTDGKTTTVNLIYHIFKKAGLSVSMVSTVGAVINGEKYDVGFHVTTPSPWLVQRFFKKAAELIHNDVLKSPSQFAKSSNASIPASSSAGLGTRPASRDLVKTLAHEKAPRTSLNFLVLEVTSHALDQHRVWGIDFEVGVLTNITREHLDYHKTYGNYVKAKAKLLQRAKTAIVNKDDESYKLISNLKWITYGMTKDANINPENFPFKTDLIGEYNKYNILAAVGVCKALGLKDEQIRKGIESFRLPVGRAEVVYKKDFTVMVDFAHTPNALEKILSAVKPTIVGRLIHVFGSAGERDRGKRPIMGNSSSRYSDIIILTAEDPRHESVKDIMKEIEVGIEDCELKMKKGTLLEVNDRQEAINAAIRMAKKGDFVLITGKGHEKSMNLGNGEIAWDEYEAVRKAFIIRT